MIALFCLGISGLILFKAANVYFIMPMPGCQRAAAIDLAYVLYSYRWAFRTLFAVLILVGLWPAYVARPWWTAGALVVALAVSYAFNFQMAADQMFHQPTALTMQPALANRVPDPVHRLSPSGTRHRWRATDYGDLLHRLPHRPNLCASGR